MPMNIQLGFSPCPNDTFIFDALVHQKIDTGGLRFEPVLEDVETLNRWALEGRLDLTKISYGVLPLVTDYYALMASGGALGRGVGPLLVAREPLDLQRIAESRVAIPGEHTTAHLLFSLAFPRVKQKEFIIFSSIEQAVLDGSVDAGVIIHESRFTYQDKGLVRILDLGEFWEKETGGPIPLGAVARRKSWSEELAAQVNGLICSSLQYAFSHYPVLPDYVREHAQEMNESVMRQHISLYVNDYSFDLGPDGRRAVDRLLETWSRLHPGQDVENPPLLPRQSKDTRPIFGS
jgi:1,4-dihydroxy-6-naphthoate synthase